MLSIFLGQQYTEPQVEHEFDATSIIAYILK